MATTARTKQDVDNMTDEQSIWDSLNHSYSKRADDIRQNYSKSIAQQNVADLKRGMGRSSAAGATRAGLLTAQNKALASNYDDLIAAYEDRLLQERDKQWNRDFQTQQFEESKRQFNEQMGETKAQNEFTRNYQTNAFNYQKERDAVSDKQWQQNFDYNKGRDAVSDAQWEKSYNTQNEQWNKSFGLQQQQFAYTQSSDERSYYASWVQSIAANGGEASDDMLAKAGLSRSDFEAMKAQAAATGGGGGGGGSYSPKNKEDTDTSGNFSWLGQLNGLLGNNGASVPSVKDIAKYVAGNKKVTSPVSGVSTGVRTSSSQGDQKSNPNNKNFTASTGSGGKKQDKVKK